MVDAKLLVWEVEPELVVFVNAVDEPVEVVDKPVEALELDVLVALNAVVDVVIVRLAPDARNSRILLLKMSATHKLPDGSRSDLPGPEDANLF